MVAGKVRHWKHGWIPVSAEAKAYVAGTGPKPTGAYTPKNPGKPGIRRRANPVPHPVTARPNQPDLLDKMRKEGGFTYDPKSGGFIEVGKASGYAIAVPGTETVVGREKVNQEDMTRADFAKGIAAVLMKNKAKIDKGAVLGGWYSPERNEYMVEITEIFPPDDREGAIRVGQERNQEAIFDLATGETIVTGGTGDQPDLEPDRESLNMLTEEMSPEERSAAKYYTGPGFVPLNTALRTGSLPPLPVEAYQGHLDRLLTNSRTKGDVTTYRGLNSWPGFPDYFPPGSTYSDAGYMSTAVGDGPPDNYKGDVMMSIHVPTGAHALDLNAYHLSHHPEERELLLPHGSQFNVISDVRGADGKRMISMELVSGVPGGEQ